MCKEYSIYLLDDVFDYDSVKDVIIDMIENSTWQSVVDWASSAGHGDWYDISKSLLCCVDYDFDIYKSDVRNEMEMRNLFIGEQVKDISIEAKDFESMFSLA